MKNSSGRAFIWIYPSTDLCLAVVIALAIVLSLILFVKLLTVEGLAKSLRVAGTRTDRP